MVHGAVSSEHVHWRRARRVVLKGRSFLVLMGLGLSATGSGQFPDNLSV